MEITAATKACAEVRWARLATLPAAASFPVEKLAESALDALRPSVRKNKTYVEAQQRYRSDHRGFWDRHEYTNFNAYTTELAGTRFSVVSLQHFLDCESFSEDMTAFFRAHGGKGQRALPTDLSKGFFPELALDLNGDGMPEWLSDDALVGWDGKGFSVWASIERSDYGCAC